MNPANDGAELRAQLLGAGVLRTGGHQRVAEAGAGVFGIDDTGITAVAGRIFWSLSGDTGRVRAVARLADPRVAARLEALLERHVPGAIQC